MTSLSPSFIRGLPLYWIGPAWLVAFLSPTALVVFALLWERWELPILPVGLVVGLCCFLPVAALLACSALVWFSRLSLGWRVAGLAATLLGMALQCGLWFVFLMAAISMAIAPAQ